MVPLGRTEGSLTPRTTPTLNETDLLWAFISQAPKALPSVRIYRRAVVNVQAVQGFRVRAGIPGQADAYALCRGGLHVELETKAATGRLEQAQKRWRAFCREFRIPHMVLRAAPDEAPEATVERWIDELAATLLLSGGRDK